MNSPFNFNTHSEQINDPNDDPDLIEARKMLDAKFPGAIYDTAMRAMILKRDMAKTVKKRCIIFLVKFGIFTGVFYSFFFTALPFSFLNHLLIIFTSVIFAWIPLKAFVAD